MLLAWLTSASGSYESTLEHLLPRVFFCVGLLAVFSTVGLLLRKSAAWTAKPKANSSTETTSDSGNMKKIWSNICERAGSILTYRRKNRGMSRPMTPLLLAALTLPSVTLGFAVGYEAREVQQARNTEFYAMFKVLRVYDPWDFQVQFVNGGDPFLMKFVHDGSENKLGWDEGMIIKYIKFEKKAGGMSVADDHLGMEVLRQKDSPKFIDFREGQ